MTEAAETTIEDVEGLRTKLRQLKTQARDDLEELRRHRDKMREYKSIRDEHNKEVRALIESVKAEREARDAINTDITDAKERRTALHAQLKSIYDEIRELRGRIVGSPSTDQRRMMRRVEELDWRQQTEQLTMDEERSIVEEVAKLETQLVKIGQEKEKQDRISELRRLARKLKEEASDAHKRVLELSEQSQIHHQEVVRIRPQLEEFKKSADTAHQNFVEWLKKVKDGEEKLKEIRTQIEDIQGKLRKHVSEQGPRSERRAVQREEQKERTAEAVEKLQSGKRLTFDEFILAQRSVTDDKKRGHRRGGSRRDEVTETDASVVEEAVEETPPEEEVVEETVVEAVEETPPEDEVVKDEVKEVVAEEVEASEDTESSEKSDETGE